MSKYPRFLCCLLIIPRWYAPPPKPQEEGEEEEEDQDEEEENTGEIEHATVPDSAPIDFNTFVPLHDPTLGVAQTSATHDFTKLTKDQIFEKALSASYWAGYWTGMYHVRRFSHYPPTTPNRKS